MKIILKNYTKIIYFYNIKILIKLFIIISLNKINIIKY
jgi:hypothetical protein